MMTISREEKTMAVSWKSLNTLALSLCGLLMLPLSANAADEVEGVIKGVRCVTDQTLCVEDKRDPRLQAESDFVLEQPDGSYYYIFNIDRDTKAEFVLDTVRVTGQVSDRYQSIKAQKMEVRRGDRYRTVWTPGRPYDPRRQPGATRF